MEPARIAHVDIPVVSFEDGLGQRSRHSDPAGSPGTEILTLRSSFATVPSFEFALRERAARLAPFRHASFVRVRSVDRTTGVEPRLRVVSDAAQGIRLSDLLAGAHARQVPIDINAALCLVRQLVPAIAMLHERARDVAHGAISLERLVVTPQARLLIVEYILGAALEQLRYPRERYWSELHVALPAGSGAPRLEHRTDVLQIGVAALSLILGRQLRPEEFPNRISDVVASTWAVSPRGGFEPLPPGLRGWLARALQIDQDRSFHSAVEARAELDVILGDNDLIASPASLDAFLARFDASEPLIVAPPAPRPDVFSTGASKSSTLNRTVPIGGNHAHDADFAATPAPDPIAPTSCDLPGLPELVPIAASTGLAEADIPQAPATLPAEGEFTADREIDDEWPAEAPVLKWQINWRLLGAAAAVVVVVAAGSSMAARKPGNDTPPPPSSGTLELSSNPPGVEALVDGVVRGTTPMTIALDPGEHDVQVRAGGDSRSIPITINPGMKVSQYVELGRDGARAGAVRVPAASPAGPSPATTSMPPANPPVAAAVPGGRLSVDSRIDVRVFEAGTLVGAGSDALPLAPGRHQLELVNTELGVRTMVSADIRSGKTTRVTMPVPNGVLSINALPWAEVWVDGEKAGETPIGNLEVGVGSHDVVFRHPELGERHMTAVVTAKTPTRISVDLRAR